MGQAKLTVIVAGGGVFGVTAALELRRRGHTVTLFDPGPVPRPDASSTDISKAIRMDYGSDEFYTSLMEWALEGWEIWNRQWERPLYHQSGFLFLSAGPMRPGGFEHESFDLLARRGHPLERTDAETLKQRFSVWNARRYPDGYYNPRGGWAESGAVVARLAERACSEGVMLREGLGMQRLIERGSKVTGIVTADGKSRQADYLLVAAGAWTPSLLPELRDVMWAVGQPVLYFRPQEPSRYRPPAFPTWAADIANTGWYGFPATEDGTLKIANHGPGRHLGADEPRVVDPGEEERFRRFLAASLPSLAGAPLTRSRLCLYCDTWDGNFWIGHHPERPGLFVASGGSGHAFKFAPVLGGIIVDLLEGKPSPCAARFGWRRPGDRTTEAARHL